VRFLKDQDLQTLLRAVGLTLGYLPGEPGCCLLTDKNLQSLLREVGLTLRYLPGFGLLTDQSLQTISRGHGLALGDRGGEPGIGLHHWLSEEDC